MIDKAARKTHSIRDVLPAMRSGAVSEESNEDSHVKLEYDLYYVKHASPLLDLRIVLQTLPVMLLGKGQ